MLVVIACALGRFVIADICQKQNRVCLWHMSITKNQKSQDSLPEGLHNALTGKNIFLKTDGCLKKNRTSARTCGNAHRARIPGHALRGTYAGHEHVGTHTWPSHMRARTPGHPPDPRTCGHSQANALQLCAQAFSVNACTRAGYAGACGLAVQVHRGWAHPNCVASGAAVALQADMRRAL